MNSESNFFSDAWIGLKNLPGLSYTGVKQSLLFLVLVTFFVLQDMVSEFAAHLFLVIIFVSTYTGLFLFLLSDYGAEIRQEDGCE